jgi:hypothetical protein
LITHAVVTIPHTHTRAHVIMSSCVHPASGNSCTSRHRTADNSYV